MKTLIYRQLSVLLAATLIIVCSASSQSSDFSASHNAKNPIPETLFNNNSYDPVVTSKALSAFSGFFKNAANARWYQVDNRYLVKFTMNGREMKALYDKKGIMIYSIAYGSEKHLPTDVRRLVKVNYIDFDITHAIEVNTLGKTAWIVKLDDGSRLIAVKVVDGELEETENFQKPK